MASKPIPYYFPGEFSPANRYDLNIAQWLSRKVYEVSEVIIVIGKGSEEDLPIDLRADIWQEYLKNNKYGSISVHKDDRNSPLTSIYKMHERLPEDAFGIALPEKVAKNKDFQDHFAVFTDYEVIITPPYDKDTSGKMLSDAASDDFKGFSQGLPPSMPLEAKQGLFKDIKAYFEDKSGKGTLLNEKYWIDVAKNMLNAYK